MAGRVAGNVVKLVSLLCGAAVTVASVNYGDVGASKDISLQSPEISWEIEEAAEEPVVYEIPQAAASPELDQSAVPDEATIPETIPASHDLTIVDDNTFTVTSSIEDDSEELIDESLFTYDGTHVRISVNLANVRKEPSVDSEIIGTAEYGTDIIRISYGTTWSKIRLPEGEEGFILSSLVTEDEVEAPTPTPTPEPTPTTVPATTTATETQTTSQSEPAAAPSAPSYTESDYSATVYASCALNVRTGAGTDCSLVRVLGAGTEISVVAQTSNGWYKTSEGNYVKADLCTATAPAAAEPSATNTEQSTEQTAETTTTVTTTSSTTTPTEGAYSDFATYCMQFVGVPYVFGQSSPSGFDCSGFVKYVFANYYGVSLPHDADAISDLGTEVSWDNIQCGDVLCHDYNSDGYIDHVSIYIGNGYYIHASDSRRGVITTTYMSNVATIRRFI